MIDVTDKRLSGKERPHAVSRRLSTQRDHAHGLSSLRDGIQLVGGLERSETERRADSMCSVSGYLLF